MRNFLSIAAVLLLIGGGYYVYSNSALAIDCDQNSQSIMFTGDATGTATEHGNKWLMAHRDHIIVEHDVSPRAASIWREIYYRCK